VQAGKQRSAGRCSSWGRVLARPLPVEGVLPYYRRAAQESLQVAASTRVIPQEQLEQCAQLELDTEIVPGISGFTTVAARIGRELTIPEVAQSVMEPEPWTTEPAAGTCGQPGPGAVVRDGVGPGSRGRR